MLKYVMPGALGSLALLNGSCSSLLLSETRYIGPAVIGQGQDGDKPNKLGPNLRI